MSAIYQGRRARVREGTTTLNRQKRTKACLSLQKRDGIFSSIDVLSGIRQLQQLQCSAYLLAVENL